jgi:transcription elongation factor GreA
MSANNKEVYLTPEGLQKLQEELEFLRTVRRPEIARRIREAKEAGDVMENAGYDEAKNEQAFVEGRILQLEQMIRNAVLISEQTRRDRVELGHYVTIREQDSNQIERYLIVGSAEASPADGRISNESPLGKALMNRRVGEQVTVKTPGGILQFEIIKIE